MTSAEFAAKYRILKTLTEKGARTQIAQEVALGRMVMVHRLDVASAAENQRLISQLGALDANGAEKVFGVWDVDGAQVVVTHFLATFTDFPSWLAEHSSAGAAVDDKTVMIAVPHIEPPKTIVSHPVLPTMPPPAPPAPAAPPVAPKPTEESFTAVFGGQKAPAPPPAPPQTSESFTAVFGAAASAPSHAESLPPAFRPDAAQGPPVAPAVARFESVIPPVEAPPPQPVAPPPAPPPINPSSNDFTSLFARLDPSASTPPSSAFSITSPPPSPSIPPTAPPAPSFAPPAPSFAPPPIAPPSFAAPNFTSPPVMPGMPAPGSLLPGQGTPPPVAGGGPSEFTRILGRVAVPNVAPSFATPSNSSPGMRQQPASAPVPTPQQQSARPTRSYLPLIIALNVVLLVAILLVVLFVVKK